MAVQESLPYPPLDGSIPVLPNFLDFHERHSPSHPMWVFPPSDPSTPTSISWQSFTAATHRIAHTLRPARSGPPRAIVAILAHCDTLLYHALTMGIIRAGLVPFALSPRNSAPAVASMLQRTDCHRLVVSHLALAELVQAVKGALPEGYALQVDNVPALADVFPEFSAGSHGRDADYTPYPPTPPDEVPSPNDIVLYLHSSGSTGFPKPIPQTGLTALHWCKAACVEDARTHGLRWGSPALPPFHTMGIMMQLYTALVSGQAVTLFAPREHLGKPPAIPTPETTLEACKATAANALTSVPAFIEAWSRNEKDLEYLVSLKVLIFAGGPLSAQNGTRLTNLGVNLLSVYGGTEFGSNTTVMDTSPNAHGVSKTRDDWPWMQFQDSVNIRWVPQGDGTYELIFMTCPTHQPSVENLPNGEKGYATSDLWEPHPTKPGLWRIVGRTDDVIVLGNSEKIVPIQQESHIVAHSWVMGAVIFGRGREQPGVLVEPHPAHSISPADEQAVIAFRNTIWPQVEEANRMAPAFGRLFKEMIIFTDPARPLPRAGKGTVQRKGALDLYQADIEALYEVIADSRDARGIAPPLSWAASDVLPWLDKHAEEIREGRYVDPKEDLFVQGFDSLSATFFRNRIIAALRASKSSEHAATHVQPDVIFTHPTLIALANAIAELVDPQAGTNGSSPSHSPVSHAQAIEAMIEKYTALLPPTPSAGTQGYAGKNGAVILVTGTTGSLGAHALAILLKDEHVSRIFALIRSLGPASTVRDRQRAAFDAAQLPVSLLDSKKLVLLESDIGKDDFGLDTVTLDEIRTSTTHTVHLAWRVDFNLALASFEPHIAATVRLLGLAPSARFIFASSITSAQSWRASQDGKGKGQKRGKVPEVALGDPTVAHGSGYGEGKFVVEEILSRARAKGFVTTAVRIGQLCGSGTNGAWNTAEWVPSLVKSSYAQKVKSWPVMHGLVSWVPLDTAALVIADLALSSVESDKLPTLINVVHPRPLRASVLFAMLREVVVGQVEANGEEAKWVPMEEWVKRLDELSENVDAQVLKEVPAIKLRTFFRQAAQPEAGTDSDLSEQAEAEAGGLPLFATEEAERASVVLRTLPALGQVDVARWVSWWRKVGFIL